MRLSHQFAVALRDGVRNNPPHPGEIKRILETDNWFVALAETSVDDKVYQELFQVKIDDVPVVVYVHLRGGEEAT